MLLVALLVQAHVALQKPVSASWQLKPDADSCFLLPSGDNASAQGWALQARPLAESVDVILANHHSKRAADAVITIAPSGYIERTTYQGPSWSNANGSVSVTYKTLQKIAAASGFSITIGRKEPMQFQTSNLADGIQALKSCTAAILNKMGYKREEPTPVPAGGWAPRSDIWIKDSDYPRSELARHRGGRVLLGWIIGSDGRIRDCTALVPSGDRTLDAAACAALTRRGQYAPPKNSQGLPTELFASRLIIFSP